MIDNEGMMDPDSLESKTAYLMGPFYSIESVCELMDKTKETLFDAILKEKLLVASISDGVMVFPAWQFDPDGSVNEKVMDAAQVFYHAEPRYLHGNAGSMFSGARWATLSFLSREFPFVSANGEVLPEYKDAERLPIHEHLRSGNFVDEIMGEIRKHHDHLATS
jgi:hypothetical protein